MRRLLFQVRRRSQLIDINEWPQRSERDCWSESEALGLVFQIETGCKKPDPGRA